MIYLSKIKGLCKSLNNMLNTIYEIYEQEIKSENPKNIYLYHNFINNNTIINELNNLGIFIINDISKLTCSDILIIGPFGIEEDNLNYLKQNNIKYYDMTCLKIIKIRKSIKEYLNRNYHVLISNNFDLDIKGIHYINDVNDLKSLKQNDKIYLPKFPKVNEDEFNKLANLVKEKFKNVVIEEFKCPSYNQIKNSNNNLKKEIKNVINIDDYHDFNSFLKNILNSEYSIKEDLALISNNDLTEKELYNYKYLLTFLLYYKKYLKEITNNMPLINNKLINEEDNVIIKDAIKDFTDLNKDGKYIRGTLIALGEYFATNKNDNYLNLATAYETFESSILIHDDIIDNAKFRRGKKTIPKRLCDAYLNKRKGQKYNNDTIKLANSIGICVGDYGLFEANKIIYENYFDHPLFTEILKTYNDIIIKTIKGEIIDVFLPFVSKYQFKKVEEDDIKLISHLKTSWYTIIGPFTLGYLLGEKNLPKDLEYILNNMGIYYQIKDDILGIFGDKEKMGKSIVSDIKEFKQTILYSYIINTEYKKEFLKIYGKDKISNKKLQQIRKLLIASGSLKYAEEYLDNLYYDSLDKINNLDLKEELKDILKGLLMYLKLREK